MKFRAMVRDPAWQGDFLAKSLAERNGIFNNYREISKATTTKKPPEIMDVAQSAVENVMRRHNVRRLIHGHTHRPGEHVFTLDGAPARRMVLGAWYEQGSVLRVDAKGWALGTLPTAA
jgi:UDP-2,3-diacylglucosamine hydrolase